MTFEAYDRTLDRWTNRRAAVSIRKGGAIALNFLAFRVIGNPEAVQLLFDRAGKQIGIKPCHAEDEHAFKVYSPGRNGRADKSASIHARGFLRYYKIAYEDGARRFKARYEDGMLIVDAREPLNKEGKA